VGALAVDDRFLGAYNAGDVHLECAKLCGMVTPDMDPSAVKRVRKEFKVCNLAVVYRAGFRRIAAQLGKSEAEARHYMATHEREFWRVHAFVEAAIEQAMHEGVVVMQDGWRRTLPSPFNPAAAANAPIQGTAAAIYRQAVLGMYRARLPLIATVHDSFVLECAIAEAADLIATATRIMVEAGAYFLPRLKLKVDVATSIPVPTLPQLTERLADPGLLEAYLRHLERARKARAA
jgi:DNA polymerase-1